MFSWFKRTKRNEVTVKAEPTATVVVQVKPVITRDMVDGAMWNDFYASGIWDKGLSESEASKYADAKVDERWAQIQEEMKS